MGLAVVAVAECRIGQILPWHLFESEREAVGAPAAGLECCFAAWQIEGSAGMAVAAAAAEEFVDVAAAVVAAGRTATWGGTATTETAEAEAFATSGWKGSHRMMGSDGAAAAVQVPCSSMASLGAWVLMALTFAWRILETPSDFVDWGNPRTIGASSES